MPRKHVQKKELLAFVNVALQTHVKTVSMPQRVMPQTMYVNVVLPFHAMEMIKLQRVKNLPASAFVGTRTMKHQDALMLKKHVQNRGTMENVSAAPRTHVLEVLDNQRVSPQTVYANVEPPTRVLEMMLRQRVKNPITSAFVGILLPQLRVA